MGVRHRFSDRDHGDLRIDADPVALDRRRRALADGPWTWLRQVHGADVVVVTEPGEHAGAEADAAVTAVPGAVLAIHTADCAPVVFLSDGVVGAAHVGWRGLVGGVVEATVDAMTALGASPILAQVGPHIQARCYEFGVDDLAIVSDRYGPAVRAETAWGSPALDLRAGILAAIAGHPAVGLLGTAPGCTACEPDRYFSHRARGDVGRHAAVISLSGPAA